MMQRRTLELWVGLFVVAGLAALAMLAFQVGNVGAGDVRDAYRLDARFNNIGGLKAKAPVTLAGVRIGRVADIYVDPKSYEAVVVMNISGRYASLPKDTSASILTSGVLGEQYVGLEPGGDEIVLKNGDRIKITQSALVLENLIGQFLFSKVSEGEKK